MPRKPIIVAASDLKIGDVVLEAGQRLYTVRQVMKQGFHVEVITSQGFPVKLSDVEELEVIRK